MKSAIEKLMDATTEREVNWIITDNEYKVPTCQVSRLYKFGYAAKARIQRINTEKMKSYKNMMN